MTCCAYFLIQCSCTPSLPARASVTLPLRCSAAAPPAYNLKNNLLGLSSDVADSWNWWAMKLLTVIASGRCPIPAEMILCIWTSITYSPPEIYWNSNSNSLSLSHGRRRSMTAASRRTCENQGVQCNLYGSMENPLKMWWMNHLISVWSVCFDWNRQWWTFYLRRLPRAAAVQHASTLFIDHNFIRFFRISYT